VALPRLRDRSLNADKPFTIGSHEPTCRSMRLSDDWKKKDNNSRQENIDRLAATASCA